MEEAVINQPDPLTSLLPLIIITIPVFFICRQLAKEKNKNVGKWTVLGLVPFVNYFAMLYLIGTPNLQLENKIDRLLARLEGGNTADQVASLNLSSGNLDSYDRIRGLIGEL